MTPDSQRHERVLELFESTLQQPPGEREAFLTRACQGDSSLQEDVQTLLTVDAGSGTGALLGTMTPDAWQSIEKLFQAALSTSSSERLAYLDAACPDDPASRQLLRLMLGYQRGTDGLLSSTPAAAYLSPSPNESWHWSEGAQVGHHVILRPISRDWTGEVYEARDTRSGQVVTLQAVRPEFAARLRDKRRTAAGLSHPRICALHEVSRQGDVDYFVMESVAGVTLEQKLKSDVPPLPVLLELGVELCDVLQYTHRNGLVHRELNPRTILTSGAGIKLLDFGVIKTAVTETAVAERTLTALGVVAGTAVYMSPEQVSGHAVDERSDVFSVGAILYEAACGERAFGGASLYDTLVALLAASPRALAGTGPRVPRELEQIILRCLAKRPEDRFEDVGALQSALQGVGAPDPVTHIGPYRVLGELGRGAMGVVYRAEDPDIRREVAIKVIQIRSSEDSADRATLRERFLREARAAGSLSHPNIITVYHLGEHEGQPYIVMEMVNGGSMERYMQASSGDHAQQESLLDGLRGVAEALDFAHSHSIIHRDIKPSNILVSKAGVFKVGDFGVAKILNESDSLTGHGLIGSPLYWAPEQLCGSPANARTDQYALGVTAYRVLTRQSPYQAESTEELLFKIVSAPPPLASSLNRDLHPSVDSVMQRVLSKDPAQRFNNCHEFANALYQAVKVSATAPPPAKPPPPLEPPPVQTLEVELPEQHRVNLTIPVLVGILLLLLAATWIHNLLSNRTSTVIQAAAPSASPPSTPPALPDEPSEWKAPTITKRAAPDTHPVTVSSSGVAVLTPPKIPPKIEPKGDPLAANELYLALKTKKPMPVIEALLNRNPLIDGRSPFDIPLVGAAEGCEPEAARRLLAKGANPNAPYTNGMAATYRSNQPTALMQAAANGCVEVVEVLLNHGANPNLPTAAPPLVEAVLHKSEPVVRFLLDHGADPNLHATDSYSPLGAAVSVCDNAMVTLLLDRTVQIDITDSRGRTPLMEAALTACRSMIPTLLAKGARVNQSDALGKTAISHLLEGHYSDSDNQGAVLAIARDLIKAGANPNVSPRNDAVGRGGGVSPLMLAAEKDMGGVFRLLLESGADAKAVDGTGRTTVMHAVSNDNAEAVELLLARGAPAGARDKKGMTAFDYAKERPDSPRIRRIVVLLRNAGAAE